jgi:hypothetical protein
VIMNHFCNSSSPMTNWVNILGAGPHHLSVISCVWKNNLLLINDQLGVLLLNINFRKTVVQLVIVLKVQVLARKIN